MGASGNTDAEVVGSVLRGRGATFECLVARYYAAAKAYAVVTVKNEADAEDVVQEAFLRAYRSLDSLKDPRKFAPWFFTIVRNTAHTMASRRDSVPLAEPPQNHEPDPAAREIHAVLRDEIAALEPPYREVISLHYFAGKTTGELAALLGIHRFAAQKRLQRARRMLGDKLVARLGEDVRPFGVPKDRVSGVVAAVLAVPPLLGGLLTGFHYLAQQRLETSEEHAEALEQQPAPVAPEIDEAPPVYDETEINAEADDVAEEPASTEPPSIWGIVMDTEGNPIAGAEIKTVVNLAVRSVRTNKKGAYAFRDLPPDEYMLRARHSAHLGATIRDVPTGDVYNIVLQPAGTITGRVVRADTGEPITDYEVECSGEVWNAGIASTKLSEGRFRVTGVGLQPVALIVSARGFARHTQVTEGGGAGKTTELVIPLTKLPMVNGEVVDASGRPVAEAKINAGQAPIWGSDEQLRGYSWLAESDVDGHFVLDQLAYKNNTFSTEPTISRHADRFDWSFDRIVATHPWFAPASAPLPTPVSDEDVSVQLVLSAGGKIAGRVTLANAPVAGTPVAIAYNNEDRKPQPGVLTKTDALGRYEVEHVTPGAVRVVVNLAPGADGVTDATPRMSRDALVAVVGITRVDFDLEPMTASIQGTVTRSGQPLSGDISVWISNDAGTFYRLIALNPRNGANAVFSSVPIAEPAYAANKVFVLDHLPEGDALLRLRVGTSDVPAIDHQVPLTLTAGKTTSFDLALPEGVSIEGVVDGFDENYIVSLFLLTGLPDTDGCIVEGRLVSRQGEAQTSVWHFHVPSVPSGTYTLVAEARRIQRGEMHGLFSGRRSGFSHYDLFADHRPYTSRMNVCSETGGDTPVFRAYAIVDVPEDQAEPIHCNLRLPSPDEG